MARFRRSRDGIRPAADGDHGRSGERGRRVGPPISLEEAIAVSNEDMSGQISEARRRALEASVAPGADIDLTYEEAQALWDAIRAQREVVSAQAIGQSVIRQVPLGSGPRSLYMLVTRAPQTRSSGSQVLIGQA
jgi:hypothetical protein